MASTMETFAKVAGVTSMATGGIENLRKIITGEAKMLKNQQKRQRAELKEHTQLMIAEEKDVHANWLREKGSLIQAVKDDASGYDRMSKEERELNEELRIEKIKQKQLSKKLFWREQASKIGGLEETEFLRQHQFNLDAKAARQAEKDLKKKEKNDLKRDELRIAELAAGYERLGAFDGMDKKDIAATIRKIELQEKANERDNEIAGIQEKYLDGSNVRLARLVANLKSDEEYSGKFKNMSDQDIITAIKKSEAKQKELDRLDEIAKAEESILGEASPSAEPPGPAGPGPEEGEPPTVGPENIGGDVSPGSGFSNADVVAAIEEQTGEIITGLGTHTPPFLETLTKDGIEVTKSPTVEAENIGVESAPDTNGVNGSDVVQPVILTDHEGDPVVTESEQMESLLAIEDKKMDYLRRGEAREIKANRQALEAQREANLLARSAKPASPTLMKATPEKGGGLLSMLGSIFMSPLGRIGTALTGLVTGATALTGATGLLSTATSSLGNFANKLLPNWMKKMLPAPGSPTVGAPATKGVGRGNAPGSKASQFKKGWNSKNAAETAKHAKGISKNATRATKLLGRAALPLTIALEAFNMYSTEQDESLDRTEKNIKHTESVGGIGGATAGGMAGAAIGTAIFPGVGTVIGGLIGGGLGYFLGGEISKTVAEEVSDKTDLATGEDRLGELPESDQKLLMKEAERQGAVDVGLGHGTIDDLEKLSKLDLSTIESLLDQETWEKEDKEQLMKIRAAKKEGRELTFKDGGFWDDDTLTAGEKGTAGPSINVEEKLQKLREEDEAGKKITAEIGGFRQGRGKESKMTADEIEAEEDDNLMMDAEFEDGDGTIAQQKLMKKYGIKGKYSRSKIRRAQDRAREAKGTVTINGKEVKKGGPEHTAAQQGMETSLATDHAADERAADSPSVKSQEMSGTWRQDPETLKMVKMSEDTSSLDPENFEKLTPDVELQDNLAEAGTKEGSIFTHDTNIESALWDIWAEEKSFFEPSTFNTSTVGIEGEKELPLAGMPGEPGESTDFAPQLNMFGNAPDLMAPVPVIDVSPTTPEMGATGGTIPSGMLEQSLITKMMEMQKQVDTGGGGTGGGSMVNAPTVINNDNSQSIQSGSTAHAGVIKPGTGRG